MKKIKLVINSVPLAPGGGISILLRYLCEWKAMGAPFEIVVFASRQYVIDAIQEVRPDALIIPFAYEKPSWMHFLLQQTILGRKMMEYSPDVVMNTNMSVPHCSVPQLVHHRNLYRWLYPSIWPWVKQGKFIEIIKDRAARRSYLSSGCNVFISEYLKNMAQSMVTPINENDYVIYNGFPDAAINSDCEQPRKSTNRHQLLAIQDTQPHKDNESLLLTLQSLVQNRPEVPWKLNIAGRGDWAPVQKRASELGILDRITFLGYVTGDEFKELFSSSLCLVFTSLLEAFGNPPLEAMASGCPVVACNCTAIPEVVGDAAILVEPKDVEAFVQAIQRLYDDPTEAQGFINKGLERVRQFSCTASAKSMLERIEALAK